MTHDGRECPVYVIDLDGRQVLGRETPRGNDGSGAAIVQALVSFGLVDQRDLSRPSIAQRRGPVDYYLAVTDNLPADQRRKLGKSGLHVAESFPG